MSDEDDLNVDAAYALETPEDNKKLYAAWATTYDEDFAEANDFLFPRHVADVFQRRGGKGPVLDVGAGTGLVAQALMQRRDVVIDGFDLSEEMLAVARDKALYRRLTQGDLKQRLPYASGSYTAVVSSGTFTYGHVGPEALDELMRVAATGALFVLSVKADIYESHGFRAKFNSLQDKTEAFETEELPVYGAATDAAHAGDTGLVVSFIRV